MKKGNIPAPPSRKGKQRQCDHGSDDGERMEGLRDAEDEDGISGNGETDSGGKEKPFARGGKPDGRDA